MSDFSRVRLLATPWTAAYQAPPSMGFSRQEYWGGVPLPSLSVIHVCVCVCVCVCVYTFFFKIFFLHYGLSRRFDIVAFLYSMSLLFIPSKRNVLHLPIPHPLPRLLPLGRHKSELRVTESVL